jgi:hypothetical protein
VSIKPPLHSVVVYSSKGFCISDRRGDLHVSHAVSTGDRIVRKWAGWLDYSKVILPIS